MKNILLLYPEMLFYKISIFNKLSVFLNQRGYKLIIWYRKISDPNRECNFIHLDDTAFTIENYQKILKKEKIDIVINILFKSDPGIFFYFESVLIARRLKIPVIYYGHGINKQRIQWWRNILYNLTYFLFDGIILYSPAEKAFIWKRFHNKITLANNTLDLGDIHIKESKELIKTRFNIGASKILLTTGRLHARKKIDLLCEIFVENFKESTDVAWIVVGPDLDEKIRKTIESLDNAYYLGPISGKEKMGEIFSISDVYCIPGAMGLGIVEALYWGLPVVTLADNNGPEGYYLKDGLNSLIARDKKELAEMLNELLYDDKKRTELSVFAKKVYKEEATLDKMFEGFILQLKRI